ncbi:MAG TPA: ABC transporter substrate binding protein [bacterium]|nr:ABC transporter substrate binding protein [bacterium]
MNRCLIVFLLIALIFSSCSKKDSSIQSESNIAPKKIYLIAYSDNDEYYMNGLMSAMKGVFEKNNIYENKDYSLRILSAQADMSGIPTLIDMAKNDKPDLLITFHSAVLYSAIARAPELKKIFSIVSNPFILGAGKSDTDHIANLTGAYDIEPADALISFSKECFPHIKKIGLIYMLGEEESEFLKNNVSQICQKMKLEFEAQPYTTKNEISDAINSLFAKKIDAVIHTQDLNCDLTYAQLSKKSAETKIPFLAYWNEENSNAAVICDNDDSIAFNKFADMVLTAFKGGEPTKMPFVNIVYDNIFNINLKAAEASGFHISDSVLKKAHKIIGRD